MTPVAALTVHRFLPADQAEELAQRVLGALPVRRDLDDGDGRSARHLWIGDAFYGCRTIPEIGDLIESIRVLAERHVGEPVITSPWRRSAWSVIVYGPGDWIGWHHDTNSVTAVLTLQSPNPMNSTIVSCSRTQPRGVAPCESDADVVVLPAGSGDLVIFDGKTHLHGTAPYPDAWGTYRVSVPVNLYRVGDIDRDPETDDLIYG